MAITLHIIFGLVAFVGSVFSGAAFGEKFKELTFKQKLAIALSYVGVMGSTVLGISSRLENPIWLICITAAIVAFTGYSFFKPAKKCRDVVVEEV